MPIKRIGDVELEKVGVGKETYKQVLIGKDDAPNFAMRRFIIKPGGSMPKHTNTVEHEQIVLDGEAEIGIGDEVMQVRKGSIVFISAGTPHWYRCVGDKPFEFLCVIPHGEDKIHIIDD